MLATVFAIPTGFALLIWYTYRAERKRAKAGDAFEPEGKLRWSDDPGARS